jgi:hypothetical protein
VWDFVHSEVPLGDDTVNALEIFTSPEAADAESTAWTDWLLMLIWRPSIATGRTH